MTKRLIKAAALADEKVKARIAREDRSEGDCGSRQTCKSRGEVMSRLRLDRDRGELVSAADGSVRGTQSFVRTLSECWSRPSLTLLEVLWRWTYGVPVLALLWHVGKQDRC